jgi:hypothetical protein
MEIWSLHSHDAAGRPGAGGRRCTDVARLSRLTRYSQLIRNQRHQADSAVPGLLASLRCRFIPHVRQLIQRLPSQTEWKGQ